MDRSLPTSATGPVVVAIDDSLASRAALAWAAEHARTIGAELHAVHVLRYDFGDPVTWAPGLMGAPHTVSAEELSSHQNRLHELFASIAPEPSWSLRFLEGLAGHEILDAARDARLLVIGTREHRGLERLLVGSVSHYCLTHAPCPIVAVPPTATTEAAAARFAAVPAATPVLS